MKVPIIQQTSGTTVSRPAAIQRERVTPLDVSTAKGTQEALDRTQRAIEGLSRANPVVREMTFVDVACTAGQAIRLRHGFGKRVAWHVVDWVAANNTDPFSLARDIYFGDQENTLSLQSSKTGTVSIRVYA